MNTASETKDYRKLSLELAQQNAPYLVIGFLILGYFGYFLLYQYGGSLQQTLTARMNGMKNIFMPTTQPDSAIVNSIVDAQITPISPSPGELHVADDQGQITAIQSGQVTYRRNKYVIQPGDSLQSIAKQAYGDENAWVRIAQANNIDSPDHIEIGMELVIPR